MGLIQFKGSQIFLPRFCGNSQNLVLPCISTEQLQYSVSPYVLVIPFDVLLILLTLGYQIPSLSLTSIILHSATAARELTLNCLFYFFITLSPLNLFDARRPHPYREEFNKTYFQNFHSFEPFIVQRSGEINLVTLLT